MLGWLPCITFRGRGCQGCTSGGGRPPMVGSTPPVVGGRFWRPSPKKSFGQQTFLWQPARVRSFFVHPPLKFNFFGSPSKVLARIHNFLGAILPGLWATSHTFLRASTPTYFGQPPPKLLGRFRNFWATTCIFFGHP